MQYNRKCRDICTHLMQYHRKIPDNCMTNFGWREASVRYIFLISHGLIHIAHIYPLNLKTIYLIFSVSLSKRWRTMD